MAFRLKVNGKSYHESKLAIDVDNQFLDDLEVALEAGFQQIAQQGPICGEPLHGLMFTIHELSLTSDETTNFKSEFSSLKFRNELHAIQWR
jgi:translation elongation factor EF-G